MSLILILSGNFFVLILCLIGAQSCFFARRWGWFWAAVMATVVSGACISDELYQWLAPPGQQEVLSSPPLSPL